MGRGRSGVGGGGVGPYGGGMSGGGSGIGARTGEDGEPFILFQKP